MAKTATKTSTNTSSNGTATLTPKSASKATVVDIPALNIRTFQLKLVGKTPLIVHKFSEKARKEMLDKQMGVAKGPRAKKDPDREYQDSIYKMSNNRTGFPAIGFKAAAIDACSHVSNITKVEARGAFHVITPIEDDGLVAINGKPQMRSDIVRVGMGTSDIHFRGEYKEWSAVLTIEYNENVLTIAQIVNLFNTAGFAVGVGEWRPERNGMNGQFKVESTNT